MKSLSIDLAKTYTAVHPSFSFNPALNPKRCLTGDTKEITDQRVSQGFLLVYSGDILGSRYRARHSLGIGSFGQVFLCQDIKTGKDAAVKVIRGRASYYNQALVEVRILQEVIIPSRR